MTACFGNLKFQSWRQYFGKSEAKFKEIEQWFKYKPLLKFWWFHLNLY